MGKIVVGLSDPMKYMKSDRKLIKTRCSREWGGAFGSLLTPCLDIVAQVSRSSVPPKSTTEKRKRDQKTEMRMNGKQELVTSENRGKMKGCHFGGGALDGRNPAGFGPKGRKSPGWWPVSCLCVNQNCILTPPADPHPRRPVM